MPTRKIYNNHGDRWWLTTTVTPKQCPKTISLSDSQCQGVKGHDGECWRFCPDGRLVIRNSDGVSFIPVGHISYKTPLHYKSKYYRRLAISNTVEITDKDELERLNSDEEYALSKGAVIRDVRLEDLDEETRSRILKRKEN